MSHSWDSNFKLIKSLHDDAFAAVDRAIKLEELERSELAINEYKKAVALIDRLLGVVIEFPDEYPDDPTWEEGCSIIEKVKQAKKEILMRTEAVSKGLSKSGKPMALSTDSSRPQTYQDLANALQQLKDMEKHKAEALELLFACDHIKFYSICQNGDVCLLSDENTLRIVRMEKDNSSVLTFMQLIETADATKIENAGEFAVELNSVAPDPQIVEALETKMSEGSDPSWYYPLIPGVSPCFRSEHGFFLFPDLEKNDGSAVAIVAEDEPNDIILEILVQVLHGVVKQGGVIELQDLTRTKSNVSSSISETIVKGAYYVSKGLVSASYSQSIQIVQIISCFQVYSAGKAGDLINYTTPHLIARLEKNPNTTISPNVKTGVEVAHTVSVSAASIAGFVADKVGLATTKLGQFLAPHIQKHGSQLLSHTLGMEEGAANERVSDILTVCAGAVQGCGTVWEGLEQSAFVLGHSLSSNTVKVIEHKYGEPAGGLAENTFDTIGNVINLNRNYLTPKGLAKITAKNTGKAIVLDYMAKTDNSGAASTSGTHVDLKSLEPNLENVLLKKDNSSDH